MMTSCPIAASWSSVRVRRVTTPSIFGRNTSVTIAIRTRFRRFRIILLLRSEALLPAPERLPAAPWSTKTARESWSDPRGERTGVRLLRLLAGALLTRWWVVDRALKRCRCARADRFQLILYVDWARRLPWPLKSGQ